MFNSVILPNCLPQWLPSCSLQAMDDSASCFNFSPVLGIIISIILLESFYKFVVFSQPGFNLHLLSDEVDYLFMSLFHILMWFFLKYLFKPFLNKLVCLILMTTFEIFSWNLVLNSLIMLFHGFFCFFLCIHPDWG